MLKKVVFGLHFVVGGFAILLLGILVALVTIRFEEAEEEQITFRYSSVDYNPTTEDVTTGFVQIFEELKDDEFMSYVNEDGSHTLISHIGSDQYACTGSCYCDNESEISRRATSTMSRGLFYLVSAISSVLAIQYSKEHFQKECEHKLSVKDDLCDKSNVRVESNCWDFKYKGKTLEEMEYEMKQKKFASDGMPKEYRTFYCRGMCSLRPRLEKMFSYFERHKGGKYEDIESMFHENKKFCAELEADMDVKARTLSEAKKIFYDNPYGLFCEKLTRVDEYNEKKLEGIGIDLREIKYTWCSKPEEFDPEKIECFRASIEEEDIPA